MGLGVEFAKGEGPVIHQSVRSMSDVQKLKPIDAAEPDRLSHAGLQARAEGAETARCRSSASPARPSPSLRISERRRVANYSTQAMMFADPMPAQAMEHLTGVIIN